MIMVLCTQGMSTMMDRDTVLVDNCGLMVQNMKDSGKTISQTDLVSLFIPMGTATQDFTKMVIVVVSVFIIHMMDSKRLVNGKMTYKMATLRNTLMLEMVTAVIKVCMF